MCYIEPVEGPGENKKKTGIALDRFRVWVENKPSMFWTGAVSCGRSWKSERKF